MRKNIPTQTFLYLSLKENTYAKSRIWETSPPSVYRLARPGRTHSGYLQYYFAPIPEYHFFFIRKYPWGEESLKKYLQQIIDLVDPNNYYLHPLIRRMLGSCEINDLPSMPLLEAMLNEQYSRNSFQSLEIILPKDSRLGIKDTLTELLNPYLPRTNSINLVGGDERVLTELSDFFFSEYGIITENSKRSKSCFTLDLWSGESETLKFLDTMVKNGYNTKVN